MNDDKKRMPEVELNSEAAKAATHYIEATAAKHAPMAQKHEIVNNIAAGFYIGARWMEKQLGIK